MKKNHFLWLIGISAFAIVSCDKSETSSLTTTQIENTQLINDEQSVETTSTDVDAIVDEGLALKTVTLKSAIADSSNYLGTCPTLKLDTTTATKSLTIDFGTNCVGKDGKTRSGKINVTTTSFSKYDVERTISFQNFVVNGDTITGTVKKTFIKVPEILRRKAHVVENLTVKRGQNNGTISRQSDIYRIYDSSLNRLLLVTTWGSSQFTNAKGIMLSKTVAEVTPLIYRVICRQIVKGIVIVTRADRNYTIDFGDGTCDGIATVMDGTKNWTIKL
ncbi:MAG: hypothetical protein WCJ03_10135 [Bacteroidales bacterium]